MSRAFITEDQIEPTLTRMIEAVKPVEGRIPKDLDTACYLGLRDFKGLSL